MRKIASRFFSTPEELRDFVRRRAGDDDETGAELPTHAYELGDDVVVPKIAPAETGWTLTIGDAVTAHDTRAEAFAALDASDWMTDVAGRKHADAAAYSALAPYRWLDSTSTEDLPSSIDGSQIREAMIGEMARNLARAKTAIQIDGGGVSEVHESVWNSAAKAAGWIFAAVEVTDAEGRAHLWIRVRCLVDVDTQIDAGQLLFGSVAFISSDTDRYGDGEEIGARLISYALTNSPFVDGLEPHAPRARSNQPGASIALTRSRKNMPEKNKPTVRGVAQEHLAKVISMLGLSTDVDLSDWRGMDKVYEAIRALMQGATLEKMLEGGGEPPADTDPAVAEEARARCLKAYRAFRALVEGFEDEAAQDGFTTAMLALGRDIVGNPEGTPADVSAALTAAKDALVAAFAERAPDPDKDKDKPEPGKEPVMTDEEKKKAQENADAKAREAMLRTELAAEKAEREKLDARIANVEKREKRIEINEEIDRKFAAARRTLVDEHGRARLTDEDREELVSQCEAKGDSWKDPKHSPIERWLRLINTPPSGVITTPNVDTPRALPTPPSQQAALDQARALVMKEQPELKGKALQRAVAMRATREWPELSGRRRAH